MVELHLVALLLAFIVLAVQGYYFGFIRPPEIFAWFQQTTFVVMTFMLIPAMLLVLWSQAGAVDRLAATGITPHPDIRSSIGAATGHGLGPTWVFRMNDDFLDVKAFYETPGNRASWDLVADSASMVLLKRGETRMAITLSQSGRTPTLIYSIME